MTELSEPVKMSEAVVVDITVMQVEEHQEAKLVEDLIASSDTHALCVLEYHSDSNIHSF